MSQAARYLFDLDFSAPPEPVIEEQIEEIPPEPMITVAEHERLLAEARAAAFAEGEAKAHDERDLLASEQRVALEKEIVEQISMVYTEVGTLMQRLERDASNLAFAFASRFAEKLVAQEPKGEIMALLNQILAPLRKTPHISIRLNDAVADDVKAAVDQQMNELGFTGTLTILPDPAIMPGDCSVEWVDGGIGRNMRSAIRQVEQLLTDHFAHVPEDPEDPEEEEAEEAEAASDTTDDQPEAGMTEASPDDEATANEALSDDGHATSADEAADGQASDAAPSPTGEASEMAVDDLDAEREEQ
ncbi:FliH/SctL family protein [Cohaesibacter haloalkalitolerans]|uniref:FliH/SctL family protein n=1 Tax=Cohaesibacter haloalkalitolerans TaxID=1162980 RepID=UPI000E65400A|nr:FliH/SctL family protein [Cohaesibacter haloalkalitolerans]